MREWSKKKSYWVFKRSIDGRVQKSDNAGTDPSLLHLIWVLRCSAYP